MNTMDVDANKEVLASLLSLIRHCLQLVPSRRPSTDSLLSSLMECKKRAVVMRPVRHSQLRKPDRQSDNRDSLSLSYLSSVGVFVYRVRGAFLGRLLAVNAVDEGSGPTPPLSSFFASAPPRFILSPH